MDNTLSTNISMLNRYKVWLVVSLLVSFNVMQSVSPTEINAQNVFHGEKVFHDAAYTTGGPTTDKVTSHGYQKMYGAFLMPAIEKFTYENRTLKFLEIGLGCGMHYGPGASLKLWQALFRGHRVDMWEAEYDAPCVELAKKNGQLDGINVLTGDQADAKVLSRWIAESGGKFDVIIDDGGHHNSMILNSFMALWPEVNPGGYYFIEDLEISFHPVFVNPGYPPTTVVMQSWVEALHVGPDAVSNHHRHLAQRYPLPQGCDMILCQKSACVLHKEGP